MKRDTGLKLLLPLSGIVLFLFFSDRTAAGALSGLRLSTTLLIPSLFPIGVLSGCLLHMGPESSAERLAGRAVRRFFGLSGIAAVPLVLGLLGGYPLGAQLVCSMYRSRRLSKTEAIQLSAFCNHAGPAFLIGVAGNVLGDIRLGAALTVIQVLSVFLVGSLLWTPSVKARPAAPGKLDALHFGDALLLSIRETAKSMVLLTGTVTFFHAALACMVSLVPRSHIPPLLSAAAIGSLELSCGITTLQEISTAQAFPLAAFLIGWGGFCVHLQAAAAFRSVGLPIRRYLLGKLLQALICLLLAIVYFNAIRDQISISFVLSCLQLLFLIFFAFFKKSRWKSTESVL